MSSPQRDSGELAGLAEGERPADAEPAVADTQAQPTEAQSGPAPRIVVRCAGRTAVGQVRDHNEDNFVVANLETGQIRPRDEVVEDLIEDRGVMFAVCDGMGGAAAGEVASQMAVDILLEALRRGGAPKNRDALARRLVSAVEEAGRRIFESAQRERSRRGMGTTATVAVLVDKVLFLAEVGDSRGYLLRRGQLKQLTKDQSLVNQLIEAGHLTEAEAEAFEHSNIILQALGTSETVQVDLTFVELRRGDRLLMCSDGLSGLVHADMLRSTMDEVKDPAACAAKLIELAESAGGHDNITVVIADFGSDALVEPTDSDSFGYVQYPLPLSDEDSSAFIDEDTAGSPRQSEREVSKAPNAAPAPRTRPESLLPLSGDPGDGSGNALWFIGGAVALAASVAIWIALEPLSHQGRATTDPPPVAAPVTPTAPKAEVEVKVYTDATGTRLVVNGEDHGDLVADQSRSLRLHPGAYRFEAQRGGTPVAISVTTVRGDMPMDVFLQVPKGVSGEEPAAAAAAATPAVGGNAAADAPTAPQAAEAAPGEVAARPRHRPRQKPAEELAGAAPLPVVPPSDAPVAAPTTAPAATPEPAGSATPRTPRHSAATAAPEPEAPTPQPKQEIPDNPF